MFKHLFITFALVIGLYSCSNSNDQQEKEKKESNDALLPGSTGSHSEVLLIIDEPLFEGKVGELLIKKFASEQGGLPRPEAEFKVVHVAHKDANYLLKRNKSILVFAIGDSNYTETVYNKWAKPQVCTFVMATDEKSMYNLVAKASAEWKKTYKSHDLSILRKVVKRSSYSTLPKPITDLGIQSMVLPRSFSQTVDKGTLRIFKNKGIRTDQYLMFYWRDIDDQASTGQDIITIRDSIGKNFFAADREGSYMTTEMRLPPSQQVTEIDGRFAVETRGLWRTEGDLMGGPFLSYAIFDDQSEKVLTVEAMVYGPDADHRNVMLEMEAMMTSIRLK